MTQALIMILLVSAFFLAAILNLAAESRFRRLFNRAALTATGVIGAVLYGYGFTKTLGFTPMALLRALLALSRMFAGANELAAIQEAPIFRYPAVIYIFWLGHFLGFYVTASATISALGDQLLRRLRVLRLRRGPLLLIYGIDEQSLAYGRYQAGRGRRAILYVDPDNTEQESVLKAFGAVSVSWDEALTPNRRFLRRIGMKPGSRQLEVALLHRDSQKNLDYAFRLSKALTEAGLRPEQTGLTAREIGEIEGAFYEMTGKGFGSVYAFDDYELAARLLVQSWPPCGSLSFDAAGRAEGNYHAVIVGFGHMGQAVLRHLVINGQFEGAHFQADVFDPAPQNGMLRNHPMTEHYDIRFHAPNGRSEAFYAYLAEHASDLSTVILCTGSAADNAEMADDLAAWFRRGPRMPLVLQASRDAVSRVDGRGRETERTELYGSDALDVRRMDAMAMQINHAWNKEEPDPEKAWEKCDAFSRLSCRAAADFYPAVLRGAHVTEKDIRAGKWPPQGETLENLARTEHLRWCAFHYAAGYRRMDDDTWQARAERFRSGEKLPVGKDAARRLHACLIPWEELEALSEKEYAATGRRVDYRQMDRENILAVAGVLDAHRRFTEEAAK